MRTHNTGGAFITQNACLQREGNDRNKNRHFMDHGKDKQRHFKSPYKTFNQFSYHVCVYFLFFNSSQFNKENVFPKLRKSTLKMKRSTQEPRAAWAHQVEH